MFLKNVFHIKSTLTGTHNTTQAYLGSAREAWNEGNTSLALGTLTSAIESSGFNDRKVALLNARGKYKRLSQNYTGSLHDYLVALEVSQTDVQRSLTHSNIADVLRVGYSSFALAHVHIDRALQLAGTDTLARTRAEDGKALVYMSDGHQYEKAWSHLEKANKMVKEVGGLFYKDRWELEEKYQPEFLDTAAQVIRRCTVMMVELEKYKEQEHGFSEAGWEEEVKACYDYAATFSEMLNDRLGVHNTLIRKGEFELKLDNVEEAIEIYKETQAELLPQDIQHHAATELHLAEAYFLADETKEALEHYHAFLLHVDAGASPQHDLAVFQPRLQRVEEMYQHQATTPVSGETKRTGKIIPPLDAEGMYTFPEQEQTSLDERAVLNALPEKMDL